jgi:hypothetical protein
MDGTITKDLGIGQRIDIAGDTDGIIALDHMNIDLSIGTLCAVFYQCYMIRIHSGGPGEENIIPARAPKGDKIAPKFEPITEA